MSLGSLNSFKSPFLAIITKPSFPFGSVLCSCGVLFDFGNTPSLCLCLTRNWFSLSRCFLYRSSFKISSGVKGSKVMRSPLYIRTILLERPQIWASRSYNQGLPSSSWHACIGTTSHSTWSLYLPIEKGMVTLLATRSAPQSFNHWILYGEGFISLF